MNNTGTGNSGDFNSGNRNSGNRNSGHWNSGRWNSGHWNSGNRNSGNRNSGHWNSGHWNSGMFNTDEPTVRMFNRDTGLMRHEVDVPSFCYFDLCVFVGADNMTDEEKIANPEWKTTGGYLKTLNYKEAWRMAWDGAEESERRKILDLPNFDADIFEEITGIDVRKEFAEEDLTMSVNGIKYRVKDVEAALASLMPVED